MVEVLEVLSPALSALVGGLLAILGGLLVQRKNKLDANRKFLLEKIQEIYELSIETEDWLRQETIKINQYVNSGSKVDLDNLKSKSKHVRMLLKLYFNKSNEVCEELDKYEMLFFNGMQLAYTAPSEFQKPDHQKSIMGSSKLYFVALLKIRELLEEEMRKLTKIS